MLATPYVRAELVVSVLKGCEPATGYVSYTILSQFKLLSWWIALHTRKLDGQCSG